MADESSVDRVVIGETVCSKRLHFHEPHLAEVIERLIAAGKEVVLSSLALVTLGREVKATAQLLAQDEFTVELSDLSGLGLAKGPHTVGPLVNVYNAAAARVLIARGAESICLPPELPLSSIKAICTALPNFDIEVFGFGRLPLAISARCAHARAKGRTKDNCQFVCGEEPDGLPLRTLDRQSFLTINGVQTLSHTCHVILDDIGQLLECGIGGIRLSPQDCDMVAVARIYRQVLESQIDPVTGLIELRSAYPSAELSNGFLHGVEGAKWVQRMRNI
jgi:collagenase-like PrtC family protease